MASAYSWLGIPAELAIGGAMLLALTAYVLLGGADFGGGVWDFFAYGPRQREQRDAIANAIGPVWEANHVWLIFLLAILFSAFPRAFQALSIAFFVPVHLILVGIVLRGASFVFRANLDVASVHWRAWASLFGAASTVTPFLLGTTLATVSSGGIRVTADGTVSLNPLQTWFSPVSLAIGALTLALAAYLAAVFLTVETEGELQEDFRTRSLGAGLAVAVLAALLLPLTARLSPLLWEHLSRPASIPPMLVGAGLAIFSGWAIWTRRYRVARTVAVAQVVVLLWGWAFAQWPYLIYPDLTVYNSLASAPTVRFMLNTLPFGFAVLLPSLWFLFTVFKGTNEARFRP